MNISELVESKRIRATSDCPQRVSVLDLIRVITGNANPYKTWLDIRKKYPEAAAKCRLFKFPGQGQRKGPVASRSSAKWIARKVLCCTRMPLAQKRKRMEIFGCDQEDIELEMKMFTEEEIMEELGKAFAACGPLKQFQIGKYRIDMYLSKPKIAIECDEHGHSRYDQLGEMQRQAFIEEQLGCTFVRFDPYAPGFSIAQPIGEVVQQLMTMVV